MKGVVLAGGKGTRLLPFTKIINKHLLPVYNRPMIYFPIRTLRKMGYDDILIVTGGENIGSFTELLGDGSEYGVKLTYRVQLEASGIAQALSLAEGFTEELFPVILGDNYFKTDLDPQTKPSITVTTSTHPQDFGVFQGSKIVEKPKHPKSDKVVAGLYWYDNRVYDVIKKLKPSKRGELEITDVNNWYLKHGASINYYNGYWSDMGTIETLHLTTQEYAG